MEGTRIIELAVGPDTVHIIGETVTIFARRAMADWTVREFSIPPIFFQEKKYYLKRRVPGPSPYAYRYELAAWHSELGPESSRVIVYDETYVAEREKEQKRDVQQEHLHSILMLFYPVLGFCWSGFKERVLSPIGFEARSITTVSVVTCVSFFLLEGVFVLYMHLGFLGLIFGSEGLLWVDWLLFVILPMDCLVRYGHVIRGDDYPDGFLEWIYRWVRRRKKPE